ncbi:helix-turn-helix domain-containing protein [Falsiroseomonas sp. E2-1-a20]|uniref:helix-turn-helix domain-containing protein n=1 Tax=Falsiroseomonas sp. E2-1-a20 TaxID=3239300 RepID=UPI003F32278C
MLTRRFLTVKEVADLVQVSEASVRHWIKLRQLRAIDLGREWRVIPRDLEAFLATHATFRTASLPADVGSGPPLPPASGNETPSGLQDGLSSPFDTPGSHSPNAVARGANRTKVT